MTPLHSRAARLEPPGQAALLTARGEPQLVRFIVVVIVMGSAMPDQPQPTDARLREITRLTPHRHETLDGGKDHEHDHEPQHGDEHMEHQPDTEHHHALRSFHETTTGGVTQGLGARPLVGDQHCQRDSREREHRRVGALAGEIPGTASKDDRVRDTIGHRIEERAAGARFAGCARDAPVEEVHESTDRESQDGPTELTNRDEPRGPCRRHDADNGENVRGDANAAQATTDGRERPTDPGAETAVKHETAAKRAR